MRIIMVAASSVDGFLTRGKEQDPRNWTSPEDKALFSQLLENHSLQVMGNTTYSVFKPKPAPGTLRVVLTFSPQKYKDKQVKGQLEFHSLSPKDFVRRYEKHHASCLLLGGSQVYTSFLEAGLVDEIYLTVEPVRHKQGVPLLINQRSLHDFSKGKPDVQILNSKGSELWHYKLKKKSTSVKISPRS